MFFLYLYLPLLFFKNKQITKKVSFLIEEDNPSTSGVRLYENNKQLPKCIAFGDCHVPFSSKTTC